MSTSQQQAEVVGGKIAAGQTFSAADQLQLVTFGLGSEEFAVDILAVQEINRMMALTRVPQSPPEVEGVINLRGKIIPVVDLRVRMGLEVVEETDSSRIIVVDAEDGQVGIIVDAVNEVVTLEGQHIEPTPSLANDDQTEFVEAVAKRDAELVTLLNLDSALAA